MPVEGGGSPALAALAQRGKVEERRDDEGEDDADDAGEGEGLGERWGGDSSGWIQVRVRA
jgi:hypothetical protein